MKYVAELKSAKNIERFIRWYANNCAGVEKVSVEFSSSQDAANFLEFTEQEQSNEKIYGTYRTL